MGILKAGFAQTDITPVGGPISLCGQFEVRITTEIHDPLMAVAMVLEKDDVRSIWVGADLNFCPTELSREVEELLADKLPGFASEQLAISVTHSHTGPHIRKRGYISLTGEAGLQEDEGALDSTECRRQIAAKIAEVVEAAWKNLTECQIEVAVAQIITGVNRRVVYKDGTAQMYGKLHGDNFIRMESRDGGPSQFLYVYRKEDHKLLGVTADVPCPCQCNESVNYVTGDYWGVVRQEIAAHYGDDVCVLGMCRAAGDLSPHAMVDRIPGYNDKRRQHQEAVDMGQWIAENIISHQKRILFTYDSDTVLKQAGITPSYELWPVTDEEYKEAKAYNLEVPEYDPSNPKFEKFKFANSWVQVQRVENQPKTMEVLIRATKIGDVTLVSLPGEIYIEFADRIRMACPETLVFDVELACSHIGYLATEAAVQGGHYSANIFNGLFTPAEGDKMVADAIALIRSLY